MTSSSERFFLYIDILGFKEIVTNNQKIAEIYDAIDQLNVHEDSDFHTIVFSDTILVAADPVWNENPRQAIMWLIEFAQDLFYRLSHRDVHFRALVTKGTFEYKQRKHFESYHGKALVDCYLKESTLKCCGVFIDNRLAPFSNIFHLSEFDSAVSFVHVMQHLDQVSLPYCKYPISGEYLQDTSMEWWVAYLFRYLAIIHAHSKDSSLPSDVRSKFVMTWAMISDRHSGLLRRLEEANFAAEAVIEMDWSEPMSRIGTGEGAWG